MAEHTLHGSGGYIVAQITEEQAKKADLGVGKLFLAPIGKLESDTMSQYFCKNCDKKFDYPPNIHLEESTNEQVADNLILVERGQYTCKPCSGIIGEYRVFRKQNDSDDEGVAKPDG